MVDISVKNVAVTLQVIKLGRKSFVSKKEEEADYEYQKYLEKKKEMEDEMSGLVKYNVAYVPASYEPLSMYVERLQPILHQLDLQLQKHYNWYVHKGSPNCPICDTLNLGYYILKILENIDKALPKSFEAIKDTDMMGNMDWSFHLKKK